MRPLQLTFEGLNSFQERQRIDFELLTRGGLFGIFGPTGSGKSTVLDAITLALFGEVVRAPHKTTGIMNVNVNRLYVSFTFSIGAGERKRIYLAERQFVRKKNERDTLECRKCALKRLDGGDEPVTLCAEKQAEMNAKVAELLGLSMKDFTHSVVLPQGQFAEFLSMNGKDRRDMLERLFGLEEYGVQLAERVKAEEESCRARLAETDAVLNEVGEASPYELQVLKNQRELDGQKLERLNEQSKSTGLRLQELKRAHQLQIERASWMDRLRHYENTRDYVVGIKDELDRARRSALVMPLAERKEQLEKSISDMSREANDRKLALAQAEKLYAAVSAEYRRKKQTSSVDIEKYQGQLGTLKALAPRQQETAGIAGSITQLEAVVSELTERVKNGEQYIKDIETRIKSGESYSQEQQRIAAAVGSVNLEQLAKGAGIEDKLQDIDTAQQETQRKLATERALLAQSEAGERDAIDALSAAQKAFDATKQKAADAEREFAEHTTQCAAAELAKAVKDGEPCPVCGSLHHPHVAASKLEFYDRRGDVAKEQVAAEQKLMSAQAERARAEQRCANSRKQIEVLLEQQQKQQHDMDKLLVAWRGIAAGMGSNDLRSMYQKQLVLDKQSRSAQEQLSKAQAKLVSLRRQLSDAQSALRNDSMSLTESNGRLKANRETLKSWQEELARHGFGGDINTTSEIEACQKRIDKLQSDLQKSEHAQEDLQKTREDAGRRSVETQAQLTVLNSQLREAVYELNDKLGQSGFTSVESARPHTRAPERIAEMEKLLQDDAQEGVRIQENLDRLSREDGGIKVSEDEISSVEKELARIDVERDALNESQGRVAGEIDKLSSRISRRYELGRQRKARQQALDLASELRSLLRGGTLVEYVADQYMQDITRVAGERLMELSAQRYHLELDETYQFVVRDMAMNGVVRACTTLSGGETFLVSLALALSLSLHIHLHGQPLGFFFLDEGFGTLDEQLLGSVVSALNLLRRDDFAIGVISHMPQLREHIPARLIISTGESGSQASMELA